jgi:hypothetical protein
MSFHPVPTGKLQTGKENLLEKKIPAIFHFIWLGGPKEKSIDRRQTPEPALDMSSSWAKYHPHHRIIHWRGPLVRRMISMHFPLLLAAYDHTGQVPWLQSVIARVAVLALMGGVYVDYDLEACGPLSRLAYPSATCVLVANSKPLWGASRIRRGIMASVPSHPFFLAVIRAVASQITSPITSYKTKKAQKLREILKSVFDANKGFVTLVSDSLLVPYGSMIPMHKAAIGVYRSPPSHHWEKWYHQAYRKYHTFCKDNPEAGRLITYFIMGLFTGIILNVIFMLVRGAINSKRQKQGKGHV